MFAKKSNSSNPETNNSRLTGTGGELAATKVSCRPEVEKDWYRNLYENFPGIYFVVDALGRVFSLNQFGEARLGYRSQELMCHSIFNIFYCQEQGKMQAEFARLGHPKNGKSTPQVACWEGRLTCKDGRIVWVKATARVWATADWKIEENSDSVGNFQRPAVLLVCEEIKPTAPVAAPPQQRRKGRSPVWAIAKLAKSQIKERNNIEQFIREVTETAISIVNCDRASIWLYGEDKTQLHCIDLYEHNTKLHSVQIIITAADCPAYFQALNSATPIATVAAENDPRTRELAGLYFAGRGTTSLLNVPIVLAGQRLGIVSAERHGATREWTEEEHEFTQILAEFVSSSLSASESLKLEAMRREQQQNLLSQYYDQLEERVQRRTAELKKTNTKLEQEIIKRKQAEAEMRRQQQEQQIIFDSLPAMIWYKDTDSRLLRINQAAAASRGLPPAQLEGKSFYEIYPDEAEQYYLEDLEVIKSGVAKLGKVELLPTASGQKCWVRTDKIPYRDETGKVAGVIMFAVDITDLVKVEKELREYRDRLSEKVEKRTAMYRQAMAALYSANTQLQQLINNSYSEENGSSTAAARLLESEAYFEAVAVADRDTILSVSSAFAELFGYEPGEMAGMSLLELLSPKSYKQGPQMISAPSNTVCETIFLRRDGTAFPADVRSKFAVWEGRLVQVKAVRNLTERKLIAAELERSRSLLDAILEATADGILAVSTAGELISFNEKLVQMWGIHEEVRTSMDRTVRLTFLTKQVKDPRAFLQRVKEIYNDAESNGCDILDFKDGRTFERYTQPIRVGQNIIGRVWRFRDITSREKVTAMLGDSQRRFRAIFDSSFQFVSLLKPDGTLLEANQTSLDFAGIKLRDVANRPFWQGPWWGVSQEVREQLQEAISRSAKGELVRYEVEFKGAHRTATIDFSLKPVADETGKIVLLLPEGRDITESKQVQVALRQQVERERLIAQIQSRIRSSLDIKDILNTTVAEVREFLATDRVIIFRFRPDWNGDVVVESVAEGWMPLMGMAIEDCCFANTYIGQYLKGRIRSVEDIHASNFAECHINFLAECQVKANLVVPIVQQGIENRNGNPTCQVPKLWGLLIAHHCSAPREWQQFDMDLLSQLATQVAIAIEQSLLYQQLAAANLRLDGLANLDSLTQLANRRRFDEVINREWEHSSSTEPLSLILCDIDCFKLYNDNYGHQAGDACLQRVARAIGESCTNVPSERLYLAARYGGEEFAVILPNTDIATAQAIAEVIRQRVKALAIPHLKSVVTDCVTLSMGVAMISENQNSPKMLIEAADKALYRAKSGGRDRVVS
ncbi:PAS domain S-box protein [Microcoleus sp. bin38.metabat.b11b12b14.051]|uniref:PAS domain S-box protein n=1 Tax=Microcoleus sp. bin38.metabat.b11b12b14.051 TaxID=2742709 RepID=UPI0025D0A8C7|nr:PAS domain S-box protein [Microcoleus sp. bin38.metabat.b11b12b14.051]